MTDVEIPSLTFVVDEKRGEAVRVDSSILPRLISEGKVTGFKTSGGGMMYRSKVDLSAYAIREGDDHHDDHPEEKSDNFWADIEAKRAAAAPKVAKPVKESKEAKAESKGEDKAAAAGKAKGGKDAGKGGDKANDKPAPAKKEAEKPKEGKAPAAPAASQNFGDLSTAAGLSTLNAYLATRSYITGHFLSRDDFAVFGQIPRCPDASTHLHVSRWYTHVNAFQNPFIVPVYAEEKEVKETKRQAAEPKPKAEKPKKQEGGGKDAGKEGGKGKDKGGKDKGGKKEAAPKPEEKKAEPADEVIDTDSFFDDPSSVTTADVSAIVDAHKPKEAPPAKKAGPVAKSILTLDVNPEEDTTDLKQLEKDVRAITQDGLLWGAAKVLPVAYTIKKIQIVAVVEDEKVSVDDLQETIEKLNGCQSCVVVSFNKI